MSLKDRIKYLRGSLSQPEFATKIGTSLGGLQKYETGKSVPNGSVLQKIHRETGIDLNWLLTGEGEPYNKGMKEGIQAADGEGLWGQTRHLEVDGQHYDVQEFSPPGKQAPPDSGTADPFVRAVGALRTIFDSHDSSLISTIQANLATFEQAALAHRYLREQFQRVQKLEDEVADLKKRIEAGDAQAGNAKTGTDSEG